MVEQAVDGTSQPHRRGPWTAPLVVFGAVELVAAVAIPYIARHMWFYHDEWDFLADRTAGNLHNLFAPHNEHWSTLPILAYRGLWQLFGLRHYAPYLMLDVLLHLTLAALLLCVLRRCNVRPWLATAAASLFVLFGSGYQDIAQAFQIGFVGSLAFGFLQLVCADHLGPLDRRDWLGLAAGAAGLMCSGIAQPMVVVVGVAVLLQRGVRVALFHTLPLALGYIVWYAAIGHEGFGPLHLSAGGLLRFTATGIAAAFGHLGEVPGVGVLLGVMLVVGSVLAWRGPFRPGAVSRSTATAIACLAGLLVFLVISGSGREAILGTSYARTSRYLHIDAALLVVPLGVAAEAIVRSRRTLLVPAIALFVVGIPGNVSAFVHYEHGISAEEVRYRQQVLWSPKIDEVPGLTPEARPHLVLQQYLSLGWLLAADAAGKVPQPDPRAIAARGDAQQVISRATFAYAIAQACRATPQRCGRFVRPRQP